MAVGVASVGCVLYAHTMSNYPPGVSGNEWQIAGLPEIDLSDVECDGIVLDADEDEVDCGFVGDVDATVQYGVAYWECPDCGKQNERELDDEPDPDEAWDGRYDD